MQGSFQPFPQASISTIISLLSARTPAHVSTHLWLRMGGSHPAISSSYPIILPSCNALKVWITMAPRFNFKTRHLHKKQMKPNSRACTCKIIKTFECLLHHMQTSFIWRTHHQHNNIWSPYFSQKLTLASCDDIRRLASCALKPLSLVNATDFFILMLFSFHEHSKFCSDNLFFVLFFFAL